MFGKKLENEDKNTVCEVCGKESKVLVPVKIDDIVYDVCPECVKKNNYTEYDGSDWASDWN